MMFEISNISINQDYIPIHAGWMKRSPLVASNIIPEANEKVIECVNEKDFVDYVQKILIVDKLNPIKSLVCHEFLSSAM